MLRDRQFVIADVGGGSTEVIVSSPDGAGVRSFTSLAIGSVRLHERHLRSDPPTPAQIEALTRDIDSALQTLELPESACLVGSAGTATSMASMALRLRDYDPDQVHGYTLSRADIDAQLAMLLAMSVAERRALPGLPSQRADVIAAGAAIFARLLHRLNAQDFVVNDRGVRWGLAYEMIAD
jgi:exopolyphosphatase/guanosine-5'-triphosphate,3'-diphosphate pyrophosphatase